MAICGSISGALLVLCLLRLGGVLIGRGRRQVLARLDNLRPPPPEELDSGLKVPLSRRIFLPGLEGAGAYLIRLTPGGVLKNIQQKLIRAGSPGNLGPGGFLGLQGILAVMGLGSGLLAARMAAKPMFSPALAGFVLGLFLPYIYLCRAIGRRQLQVKASLPDFLDLLTISVEAGLGFDAALGRVVDKSGGVLGEEFGRALLEMKMGKARRHALRDLVRRVDVENLTSFIGAVIQAEQLGVGIGSVLRIQSQSMRTKRRQWAEETAMKAPVKMLFPLIFFILPTLFVVLLGPAVILIMDSLLGL